MDPATDWTPRGLDFDGSDDYVSCGGAVVTSPPLTLVARIMFPVGVSNYVALSIAKTNNVVRLYYNNSNGWTAQYYTGGSDGGASVVDASLVGRYITLVGVFPAANLRHLYIDGALRATNTDACGAMTGTATQVGAMNWSGVPQYWTGEIDFAYIFSRALPANEVAAISSNPYAMFERRRTLYVPAGTTTGTPYYYHRRFAA